MVQAIENWADLTGTVEELRPHPDEAFAIVRLHVEDVADVEGYPNLLASARGRDVEMTVERRQVERAGVGAGARVTCRAQRASPRVVVAARDSLRAA